MPFKKPKSPPPAWDAALRLLAGRDYSEKGLTRKLHEKGYDAEEAAAAVERCITAGYVSDERFAAALARRAFESGYTSSRAVYELIKAGIDRYLAEDAVSEVFDGENESERARVLLEEKFSEYIRQGERPPERELARVLNAMARRGYREGDIADAAASLFGE